MQNYNYTCVHCKHTCTRTFTYTYTCTCIYEERECAFVQCTCTCTSVYLHVHVHVYTRVYLSDIANYSSAGVKESVIGICQCTEHTRRTGRLCSDNHTHSNSNGLTAAASPSSPPRWVLISDRMSPVTLPNSSLPWDLWVQQFMYKLNEPPRHTLPRTVYTLVSDTNLLYAAGDVYTIQRVLHVIQLLSYVGKLRAREVQSESMYMYMYVYIVYILCNSVHACHVHTVIAGAGMNVCFFMYMYIQCTWIWFCKSLVMPNVHIQLFNM